LDVDRGSNAALIHISTKSGWKVRIFAAASEAHVFSQQMSLAGCSVEAGRLRDARPPGPNADRCSDALACP
jgi:hypothetical protein